jgi:hypothetical protein
MRLIPALFVVLFLAACGARYAPQSIEQQPTAAPAVPVSRMTAAEAMASPEVSSIIDLDRAILINNSQNPVDEIGLMCGKILLKYATEEANKTTGPAPLATIPEAVGPASEWARLRAMRLNTEANIDLKTERIKLLLAKGVPRDLLVGCAPMYVDEKLLIGKIAAILAKAFR